MTGIHSDNGYYVIPDSDETLKLRETEVVSKHDLKSTRSIVGKHKRTCYWKAIHGSSFRPYHSSPTVIVEVPKELPKMSKQPSLGVRTFEVKMKSSWSKNDDFGTSH
ncbi:hypothetical protein Tco_1312345 [Tanacetum coccineum]